MSSQTDTLAAQTAMAYMTGGTSSAIGPMVNAVAGVASAAVGGPVESGAPVDARSFMDGSGWTVSTGSSSAKGGSVSRTGDPFGGAASFKPSTGATLGGQASLDPMTLGALVLIVLVLAKRRTA